MWGQVNYYEDDGVFTRIIPTRVGTSIYTILNISNDKNYPHACGDKQTFTGNGSATTGSSPRVWGQVFPQPFQAESTGIIPTRVGTSGGLCQYRLTVRDHPHACGDKAETAFEAISGEGSSPRVWGQVRRYRMITLAGGIIPTRVGTSLVAFVDYMLL